MTNPTTPSLLLSTRVRRRRRMLGEFSTAATAIRNQCLECCGYDAAEVERCTSPACHLYPWRFKQKPATAGSQGRTIDFPQEGAHSLSGSQDPCYGHVLPTRADDKAGRAEEC
jgi:hypothetical protein